MAQLPKIYVEDRNHEFRIPRLSDEEFAIASSRFVKTSTDAVIVNRSRQTIYLHNRIVPAMRGWWYIGGAMLPGETWESSMCRVFARDTGLDLSARRFQYVMPQRHWSALRGEEPQEAGEDSISFVFTVELSPQELEFAREHLVPDRYDVELGIRSFNRKQLSQESVRPAILDLYDKLFEVQVQVSVPDLLDMY